MKKSDKSMNTIRCELCGTAMSVKYTWVKGTVRKRVLICEKCGHSFTTTETRDTPPEHG